MWGAPFQNAWAAASQAAQQAAQQAMASAQAAAQAVAKAAKAAADAAKAAAQATANVAGFGARAVGETALATAKGAAHLADKALQQQPLLGPAYKAAKQLLSPTQPPRARAVESCPNTLEAKRQRLVERNNLIKDGSAPGASPAQKAAAERLARNNQAVELARLSEDTYAQFGSPKVNKPPLGWTAMDDAALAKAGISKDLLDKSKAVIYQTPADWPGGQKTVLAFRGTVPSEMDDLKTNMDQALGKETQQYQAAALLGADIGEKFGQGTLVTGHSLGGGKAQAAGTMGGLRGMMFNSAGLHPNSAEGAMPSAGQFLQYRAPYDPLTGLQNSPASQAVVAAVGIVAMPLGATASAGDFVSRHLGLPGFDAQTADYAHRAAEAFPRAAGNLAKGGYVIPPAQGRVFQVPSLDDKGGPIPATDLLGQHSVHNVVNGIEQEKSEDIATLKQ